MNKKYILWFSSIIFVVFLASCATLTLPSLSHPLGGWSKDWYINVTTIPQGANAYKDDQFIGVTPATTNLRMHYDHLGNPDQQPPVIRVSMEGYQEQAKTLMVPSFFGGMMEVTDAHFILGIDDQGAKIIEESKQESSRDLEAIGIILLDIDDDLSMYFGIESQDGVFVNEIISGSPSEKVGLKVGDVIRKIGRTSVANVSDCDQLLDEISGDISIQTDRGFFEIKRN